MSTHRAPTIHTPWSIGPAYVRMLARDRGELPQPTHRKDPS